MSDTAFVFGLGQTGMSCVRWLYGKSHLVVSDSRIGVDKSFERVTDGLKDEWPDVDIVCPHEALTYLKPDVQFILSPSIPLDSCVAVAAIKMGLPILSDVDLFMAHVNVPTYAVTGTNGKSTVTTLAGRMLAERGFATGGNIGMPVLDLLNTEHAGYVLELSSFQLERMSAHFFAGAAILNIAEDHMDHHRSFDEYITAKQRIFKNCGLAIGNAHDPRTFAPEHTNQLLIGGDGAWRIESDGIVVDGSFVSESEIGIVGRHNLFNAVASAAIAADAGVPLSDIRHHLKDFQGLEHRTEKIDVIDDVTYLDDSKATNVSATVAALNGLGNQSKKNIILLAGGVGKGADFGPLKHAVARYVKAALLFGADAARIDSVIHEDASVVQVRDLEDAVSQARTRANPGDLVLLSPACASFDQFDNFNERGDRFQSIVRSMS